MNKFEELKGLTIDLLEAINNNINEADESIENDEPTINLRFLSSEIDELESFLDDDDKKGSSIKIDLKIVDITTEDIEKIRELIEDGLGVEITNIFKREYVELDSD